MAERASLVAAVTAAVTLLTGCGSTSSPIEVQVATRRDGNASDVLLNVRNTSDKTISKFTMIFGPIVGSVNGAHADYAPTDYRQIDMPLAQNESSQVQFTANLGPTSSFYEVVESVTFADGSVWQNSERPLPANIGSPTITFGPTYH